MSEFACPYLPGTDSVPTLPLSRYLPPLPPGMITGWLEKNASSDGWLLDPFGSTPLVALEAARAGYRILVASNNPILSFLLEILAAAPARSDFQSALAFLAGSRRGNERLEIQIESLYQTNCAACKAPVQVQAYLWQRDAEQPYARIYRCPACGDEGERPISTADLERLARIGGAPLARARALERISGTEADPASIEEALKTYLPRPLSVLFTLINKVEGLDLPPERKRLLTALLLSACDDANTLWPHPAGRARPRQLTVPPQFRENNVWLGMEAAIDSWCYLKEPVPITRWPNMPPESGGICLYTGRARSLLPQTEPLRPQGQGVLAVFPRPNQAFWTLSAMWSGWLFGKEAVQPMKGALDRQHYDWYWHASALEGLLKALRQQLTPETRLFGIISEVSPALLLSVLISTQSAGYHLSGLALRTDQEIAQFHWQPGEVKSPSKSPADWPEIMRQAAEQYLKNRGEPASYLALYTAGLSAISQQHALPPSLETVRSDLSSRIQNSLEYLLRDRTQFQHFGSTGRGNETGWWWLADEKDIATPVADRVEMEVVRYLQKHKETTFGQIDQMICQLFPGVLTPRRELVLACLESYAEPVNGSKIWRLNAHDATELRHADLENASNLLTRIGESLGYMVQRGNPITWLRGNQADYRFYLGASALVSRFILSNSVQPARHQLVVIPGSRSRLLALKLARDPRLARASKNWRFLKFRHLRKLAERTIPSIQIWDDLLNNDQPNGEDAIQMRMFE